MKKILLILIACLTLTSCSILKKKHRVKEEVTKREQREIREVIDTNIVIPEINIEDTFYFIKDTTFIIKDSSNKIEVKVDYKKKDNRIILDVKKKEEVIPIKMDRTIKENIVEEKKIKEVIKDKKTLNYLPILIIGIILICLMLFLNKKTS